MYCGWFQRHPKQGPCSGEAKVAAKATEIYPTPPVKYTYNHDFKVCYGCGAPRKEYWLMYSQGYTPREAKMMLNVYGRDTGIIETTWLLNDGSKRTTIVYKPHPRKVNMDQGRNFLVEVWRKIDGEVDAIMSAATVDREYHKYRASAFAETIALVMGAYYADTQAVSQEALNRYNARQAGDVTYESPGLAEHLWDPDIRFDGTPYSRESEAKVRSGGARTITPVKLDPQKETFVKHALENGSMTADGLAKMFGVSIEVIKAAVDS